MMMCVCLHSFQNEMAKIPKSDQSQNTSVGNTNQRNKWANTDPLIYQRWNQVPRRSKHPLLTNHTRSEPSSMIMNAELSAVKVSVPSTVQLLQHNDSMKVCNYKLDHCNGHRTCETLTSNETVEIPVTSTCLSVVYLDSKSDRM
jgi:hypothetical protein